MPSPRKDIYTIPYIPHITPAVFRGLHIKNENGMRVWEVDATLLKSLLKEANSGIGAYIIQRYREYIGAQIFGIVSSRVNGNSLSIGVTNIRQDLREGVDIRVRGWKDDADKTRLVFADLTESIKEFQKKKENVKLHQDNKYIIYIPRALVEYCYTELCHPQDDKSDTDLTTVLHDLIHSYIENQSNLYVSKIHVYMNLKESFQYDIGKIMTSSYSKIPGSRT